MGRKKPARRRQRRMCKVSWCADDVIALRPRWSVAKCERFLDEYEDSIQTRMIEMGWEVIQDALRWRKDEEDRGVSIEQEDR